MSGAGDERTPLRRLIGPLLIFASLLGLLGLSDLFMPMVPSGDSESIRAFTRYALLVGLWLSGACVFNRFLRIVFWDRAVARALGGPVPKLLIDLTTLFIYIIAVSIIAGVVFKAPLTGFWTTSGVVGLILGFALRNTIADLFTGIAVNIDRPYTIGDWIQVHERNPIQNVIGEVVEMNWRTTRIRTEENNEVIIPNSVLGLMVVTNYRRPSSDARFETNLCLDFSVPTERARRVLLSAAKSAVTSAGFVSQRDPQVLIDKTTDLGVEYKVRYWITPWEGASPSTSRDVISTRILEYLSRAGLTPAYPKEDIYFDRMPVRQLDSASEGDRVELLKGIEIFSHLARRELEGLARKMVRRKFEVGSHAVVAGERGDSMLVLIEGLMEVFVPDSAAGKGGVVGQVAPGEVVGEMSLLTGEPRSATVTAVTEAVAYEITKDHVQELFEKRPTVAETISTIVAKRELLNQRSLHLSDSSVTPAEAENFARQILGKIRSFFAGAA
jgi:small-conductance mechanosensitive channel/CRP-like cAMP-binding protein